MTEEQQMRQLIVNADDFGQSDGVNRGIIESYETGIVTSASLMVRWPAARAAADYARGHPAFGVGLHVDLGEWIFRDGAWSLLYEVVRSADAAAVRDEIKRQLDRFRDLLGRQPTHLDSHQHVHRDEPVHSIVLGAAADLGIPCRGYSAVRYCGNFYGQTTTGDPLPDAISVEALLKLVMEVPAGVTELACHPGFRPELSTMYAVEREKEVRVLCDRRVREVIEHEQIVLCSFAVLNRRLVGRNERH